MTSCRKGKCTLRPCIKSDIESVRRQNRIQQRLESKAFVLANNGGTVVRLKDISGSHNMSNPNHTTLDIHDILCSYYKVARKRLVDNMRMQVADYFLVTGPESPLTLLSAEFVTGLTADQLDDIAGEDVSVKRQRREIELEMKQLQEGKRIVG